MFKYFYYFNAFYVLKDFHACISGYKIYIFTRPFVRVYLKASKCIRQILV